MSNEIEKYKLKNGNILKIFYDENPESPRAWDNLGKMVMSHLKYNLPNEIKFNFKNFENWSDCADALEKEFNAEVILIVRGYDHSGLSISCSNVYPFNDTWDSGQLGFIIATKEDIKKEYGVKRISKKILEKTKKILINEIELYDKYLNGQVYGFIEEKERLCDCCGHIEQENINSCWGFFDIQDIKDDLYKDQIEKKVN
jgi:hypothetical protein